MVVRKRRKVRKQRGARTYGRGCSKRGRGRGERGGKGLSGGHKHKWSYTLRYAPERFGKRGFVRPPEVREKISTINVGELEERLDELLERGIARRDEDRVVIQLSKLGVGKVLGGGRVSLPLEIRAFKITEPARQKVERAGGKAVEGEG